VTRGSCLQSPENCRSKEPSDQVQNPDFCTSREAEVAAAVRPCLLIPSPYSRGRGLPRRAPRRVRRSGGQHRSRRRVSLVGWRSRRAGMDRDIRVLLLVQDRYVGLKPIGERKLTSGVALAISVRVSTPAPVGTARRKRVKSKAGGWPPPVTRWRRRSRQRGFPARAASLGKSRSGVRGLRLRRGYEINSSRCGFATSGLRRPRGRGSVATGLPSPKLPRRPGKQAPGYVPTRRARRRRRTRPPVPRGRLRQQPHANLRSEPG
jgi:hypothetical protein